MKIAKAVRRAHGLRLVRPMQEGDPFPETLDPDKHRARCKALRRRRAKNRVAKQARKANR